MTTARVGVAGTGAMGSAVVQSLVRAGFPTVVRDICAGAQDAAVRQGGSPSSSLADLARRCDVVQDRRQPAGRRESRAGAEALALARASRLDLALAADVIGASSGSSCVLADRAPRAG